MNEVKPTDHTVFFSSPEAALGSPEVALVIRNVLGHGRRALKRAIIRAAAALVRAWRYLEAKSDEAVAIENRLMTLTDERYRKNPYHVRGLRGLL